MPGGIGHLVFGLFLIIPIMLMIPRDRFNWKIAVIFVLNNYHGPDSYWVYRFIPLNMHQIVGYLLWAILLAIYYSYLSRFSIQRTPKFFTVVDDGKRDISWRNAYLLCVAGGITHTFIDTFFHTGHTIDLFGFEWGSYNLSFDITFDNLLALGNLNYHISEALIIVGFIMITAVIVLVMYFLRENFKTIFIYLFAIIGVFMLAHFTLGIEIMGTELDSIVILYTFFIFFIPLILIAFVVKDVAKNPTNLSKTKSSPQFRLNLVILTTFILTSLFIFLGLCGIFAPEIIEEILSLGLANELMFGIGLIITIFASVGLIGAIGLVLRRNFGRYFVMFTCILLLFFVFPFVIFLTLNQKDIKELFTKTAVAPLQEKL